MNIESQRPHNPSTTPARPDIWPGLRKIYQRHFPNNPRFDYTRMNVGVTGEMTFFRNADPSVDIEESAIVNQHGMTIKLSRPVNAPNTPLGYFAEVIPASIGLNSPECFELFATYRRPRQTPFSAPNVPAGAASPDFVDGNWALSLQVWPPGMQAPGMGVTCQFTTNDGNRMNLPRMEVLPPNTFRPSLASLNAAGEQRMLDDCSPETVTLALGYDRALGVNSGYAALLIGNERVDDLSFNFSKMSAYSSIDRILAGIGTVAGGAAFSVQAELVDLQVWAP